MVEEEFNGTWKPTQGEMWRMLKRLEATAEGLHKDVTEMRTMLDRLTAERALVGAVAGAAAATVFKWWMGG